MSCAAPASTAPPAGLPRPGGTHRWLIALSTAVTILAACESSSSAAPSMAGDPGPSIASTTAEPTPNADPTRGAAPSPTPLPTPGAPPPLALEVVTEGLSSPIGIVGSPDGGLYVLEQGGRIVAVAPDGATSVAVDIGDRVTSGGERGLLGLAFHPGWPEVPRAFVDYTDADGATVVAELAAASDGAGLDAASERTLLRVAQPAANHNGGQLAFGPDDYLYVSLGDGGGANDQFGNGQDPATLLGTILRLDVDSGDPYGVPPDNPFVGGGGAAEAFVYGLRNPWRFSFDRVTGHLWIGDVGQGGWEEVDRLALDEAAGANLGWSVMEGAHCVGSAGCDATGLVPPVTEYPTREVGCAITGGYVYRGEQLGDLFGWYLFADYCSGLLFGVRSDIPAGELATPELLLETGASVASLGEDAAGELYLADRSGGAVYRIVATP